MAFETTTDDVLADIDLHGTVALVTGPSTGLGLETTRALAAAGAAVTLAVRSPSRGATAEATIRERLPAAALECGLLDLASLASVRRFADWFTARHDRIDILINNAGVMATPFERTSSRRTGSPRQPTSCSPSSSTAGCATSGCVRTRCIPA